MLALLDLLYLPPGAYFAHLAQYKEIQLEAWAPYLKGTYSNRCVIASANGPLTLSVPLQSGKYLQAMGQIRIAYHEPWSRRHWRSIHDAYRSAPFFEHYAEYFEPCFKAQPALLQDWNLSLLRAALRALNLDLAIHLTTQYDKAPVGAEDLRKIFQYKPHLQRQATAIQIAPYPQVFQDRLGFLPNLSILDLIFCTGPDALRILRQSYNIIQPDASQ